jgi:hypothetical protein
MSYTLTDVIIVVAILAIGCAITGALVHNSVDRRWEAEATKHGYLGMECPRVWGEGRAASSTCAASGKASTRSARTSPSGTTF